MRSARPPVLTLLVALLAAATPLHAESWRLLGARDGELAALVTEHDPERGFHRMALARIGLEDGAERERRHLLSDERYRSLVARGDYEVLRHDQERARRAALRALVEDGFAPCSAQALRAVSGEPPAVQFDATAPSVEGRWPRQVTLHDAATEPTLTVHDPTGGPHALLATPLVERRGLADGESLTLPPRAIRDVWTCGPRGHVVVLLESEDPPHVGQLSAQQLCVGQPIAYYVPVTRPESPESE